MDYDLNGEILEIKEISFVTQTVASISRNERILL
jgi:hypothetical protein